MTIYNIRRAYRNHLARYINADTNSTGYLDSVNDFPSISVLNPVITREHYGGGHQLVRTTVDVRGYTYTDEDSVQHTETLARQIEAATQRFTLEYLVEILIEGNYITQTGEDVSVRQLYDNGETITGMGDEILLDRLIYIATKNNLQVLSDARVLTLTTDEGLLTPYGVCDLTVEWLYEEILK